jgi:hypothetical protein
MSILSNIHQKNKRHGRTYLDHLLCGPNKRPYNHNFPAKNKNQALEWNTDIVIVEKTNKAVEAYDHDIGNY